MPNTPRLPPTLLQRKRPPLLKATGFQRPPCWLLAHPAKKIQVTDSLPFSLSFIPQGFSELFFSSFGLFLKPWNMDTSTPSRDVISTGKAGGQVLIPGSELQWDEMTSQSRGSGSFGDRRHAEVLPIAP